MCQEAGKQRAPTRTRQGEFAVCPCPPPPPPSLTSHLTCSSYSLPLLPPAISSPTSEPDRFYPLRGRIPAHPSFGAQLLALRESSPTPTPHIQCSQSPLPPPFIKLIMMVICGITDCGGVGGGGGRSPTRGWSWSSLRPCGRARTWWRLRRWLLSGWRSNCKRALAAEMLGLFKARNSLRPQ